jgi:hypothetical protein
MPSGTAEPECCRPTPETSPAVGTALIGADMVTWTVAPTLIPAPDAPVNGATKIMARATIHPSVNGAATARCMARPTAVI